MKQPRYYLLITALAIFACNHPTAVQQPVDTVKKSVPQNTQPEKHEPVVVLYEKDDDNILFVEDDTRLGKLGFYCYSDLSMVEKNGKPAWIDDITQVPEDEPLLMLNGNPVALSQKMKDLRILMPTYIQTFEMKHMRYLMISLNLISFSTGGGWAHILLKVDAGGKVVKDSYFETAEMVDAETLKDANGDSEPDLL
ncbi:hypothetical protein [Chitinophaga varians]|uniref:hypothetical protein n=1 Tax=Chitinophaga varians TaxID=2202339 RepID=UPI00165F2B4D|nr:hypothetical protein [Chitinophaga varians]MBC9914087.1 hypothetical protein [Chitinophaga varians]